MVQCRDVLRFVKIKLTEPEHADVVVACDPLVILEMDYHGSSKWTTTASARLNGEFQLRKSKNFN